MSETSVRNGSLLAVDVSLRAEDEFRNVVDLDPGRCHLLVRSVRTGEIVSRMPLHAKHGQSQRVEVGVIEPPVLPTAGSAAAFQWIRLCSSLGYEGERTISLLEISITYDETDLQAGVKEIGRMASPPFVQARRLLRPPV